MARKKLVAFYFISIDEDDLSSLKLARKIISAVCRVLRALATYIRLSNLKIYLEGSRLCKANKNKVALDLPHSWFGTSTLKRKGRKVGAWLFFVL